MKLTVTFLIVVLVAFAAASPAKGSTKPSLKKKNECMKQCTDDYTPICAGDGTGKDNKSFGNECVLGNFNCENKKDLKIIQKGECPGGGGVRLS
ncbi:PREDICTED: turripeptide Pal9.2-like [Nicrophorus vespilloides]|uniref:Turripeptide Pal9.2-like n=1 Tax=Nicrophorus vespilloides TaxID=110193 RepID=A0ABM1N6B0_NICVS|nr:PREDICTED: turripeptide Pal9.2-like [Nicrophorus vespilloides]